MSNPQSPLDVYRGTIEDLARKGYSNVDIVKALEISYGAQTSERSIRRALKRWKSPTGGVTVEKSGTKVTKDEAELTSKVLPVDPHTKTLDIAQKMAEDKGFLQEEWEITSSTINEWDAPAAEGGSQKMEQLKVNLRRKKPTVIPVPARAEGYIPRKSKVPQVTDNLAVILGDQHAPHHDPDLHELVIDWIADNKPKRGVLLGDLLDFPEQSRHRHDPFWTATAQECLDSGYELIRDYVQASPDTQWDFCAGNHSDRLRNTIIDQVRSLYDLRPGSAPDEPDQIPAMNLRFLLRLDELGINYVESNGSYEHAKIRLNKNLAVVHGHKAVKGSGVSALRTLNDFGHSVIMGHSHRASIVFETKHDINGNPETLTAAEAGCLCRIEGGLGYAINPDWQQGFVTATIHSDTLFKLDLATHVNNRLLWKDKCYG